MGTHYESFSKNQPDGSLSINEFIQECLNEIMNLNDPIIRDLMIKRLSDLTTVDQNSILSVLKEKVRMNCPNLDGTTEKRYLAPINYPEPYHSEYEKIYQETQLQIILQYKEIIVK